MSRTPKLLASTLSALLIIAAPFAAPAAQAQSSFGSSSSSHNFIPAPKPAPQPAPQPAPKPAPKPAPQPMPGALNQGDKILQYSGVTISDNSAAKKRRIERGNCTIGYVNKEYRYALTAAHCAEEGATIYNDKGQAIGTFYRYKPNYMDFSRTLDEQAGDVIGYDTAVIKLYDNVTVGNNIYSGDNKVRASSLPVGTRVCTYGAKSNRVQCGNIIRLSYPVITGNGFAFSVDTIAGDSGGPIWLENGGGYIGNLSLSWYRDSAGASNF